MAKMRSENTDYAKAQKGYLDTSLKASKDFTVERQDPKVSSEDFRQMLAERSKASRERQGTMDDYSKSRKETGYDYTRNFDDNSGESIDRLSRSPTSDSEGMMKYRKGGTVKKKATRMAGGGAVRGAGCATKGKGKMRMY